MTGTHGALPEEQVRAQPFQVDADIGLDLADAGRSDALADTIDYGDVTRELAHVVRHERHQLLERLAARLVEVCLADERVKEVTVEVTKLRPPVPEALESASVRITRSRPT